MNETEARGQLTRRRVIQALLTSSLGAGIGAAAAKGESGYPSKPVRFVVGFAPGGSTDGAARIIAPLLAERLGQPVVVENKTGMGGGIGLDAVAHAPPDGYTFAVASSGGLTAFPSLYKKLTYDPVKDFAPVSLFGISPLILVANASLPAENVVELIALARKDPGKLSYGSGGQGTALHLAGELFKSMTGTHLTHIPYRGSGPAMVALMADEIQLAFVDTATAVPQLKGGRVKVIGALGKARSKITPEIRTLAESGLPGYDASGWFAILAPARTPEAIVKRVNAELTTLLATPDVQARLATAFMDATSSTPQGLAELIRQDTAKWSKVIKSANITLD
jgi:tripartite-type tricarboxylate transporter receptor subunit TctC